MFNLIHFRSEDDRFSVVSGDCGHAGGGFVDLAAVVNAAAGKNNGHLLAEKEGNIISIICG